MSTARVIIGVAAVTGVAIGLGLGWLLRGSGDAKPPVPAAVADRSQGDFTDVDVALAEIRDELAFERSARIAFTKQIEQELDGLHEAFSRSPSKPAAAVATATDLGDPSAPEIRPGSKISKNSFSEAALLEQGTHPEEVRTLRAHFDETELEIHYLRDRASREGWADSSRFGQTVREKQEALRESVGDAAYDKILYATGRKNRVRLTDAFLESPATKAGILPGDVIMSYAGKRIFDPTTLYVRSTEGAMGARTEIEIARDGEVIHIFVPRGPLGARFSHERVVPES